MKIMKLTKTLLASLLAIFFAITSCSDDSLDDGADEPIVQPLSNGIQVDIDGETWRGTISSVAFSGSLTTLNAVKANSNISIQVFLPKDSVNTFNIPTSIVTVSVRRNSNVLSNSSMGTLALSANDSTAINGSFNCDVTSFSSNDTLILTNGLIDYDFN